jgi:Protein of unknown function (DUF2442)
MSTLKPERKKTKAVKASFDGMTLRVLLDDGLQIVVPLRLYPRLSFATKTELRNYRLVAGGEGLHWPDLDEDISVAGLLAKKGSSESPQSFVRWLFSRKEKKMVSKPGVQEIEILKPGSRLTAA